MSEPQAQIAFWPRWPARVFPNVAPVFIGPHRTIGLHLFQDAIGIFRASLVMDTRDGNGFQEVCEFYEVANDLYNDCVSYGSPEAWLAFVVGRINETGRLLEGPSDTARSITCTGLENLPFPQPLPVAPLPTDYGTAWNWLNYKLSNMHWTLANGFLELV